jgi:hypothetical protein
MEYVPNTDFPAFSLSLSNTQGNLSARLFQLTGKLFRTPIVSPPLHSPPTLRNVATSIDCVVEGLKLSRLAFHTLLITGRSHRSFADGFPVFYW